MNVLQTNTVSIFGVSSSKVNQIAAEISRFKKPEPYKGKGIRYEGEKFHSKSWQK
jgi:large subunit ribosomal protein L6